MKTIRTLFAATLLGMATVAGAQLDIPNPNLPGGSMDSAVRYVGSEMMVDRFISRWIRTHYPGWTAEPHEIKQVGDEKYAVVYITHPEKTNRRVWFRLLRSHADPDAQGSDFPL